jgi:hypothetical protein
MPIFEQNGRLISVITESQNERSRYADTHRAH